MKKYIVMSAMVLFAASATAQQTSNQMPTTQNAATDFKSIDYKTEVPVRRQHAMVVSIEHNATDAGVRVLHEGGNAVDAAVAVGFALAVVHPAAGNLGGGGFMLLRNAKAGDSHFIDFREEAPGAATANMYLDASGKIIPEASTVGMKASGVPGTVAGLVYAEKHYGRLGLAQVMQPAIALARDGYVLTEDEAEEFHSKKLTRFEVSKRIFQRDGNFYKGGEVFKQPELAKTLETIAEDPDSFYRGTLARAFAEFERANGGLITEKDLASYAVKEREPLYATYRGYQIITAPPSSSGGIALIESLQMLEHVDLSKMGDRTPEEMHWIAEAFRRAYMDRSDYDGDTDFVSFPMRQMLDPKYNAAFAASINATKATPSAELKRPAGFLPEPPKAPGARTESMQTTHFSVMDAEGNAVSMTYTLNAGFGAGVTVEGLGFLLNDEMDDFTTQLNAPNMFGLIQSVNNAIAPGKRPLSCMSPTIVLGKGAMQNKVQIVIGSPGGATIPTTVINDLISMIDQGMNVQEAVDAPRFHHQYLPDDLRVEQATPAATVDALKAMGYNVVVSRTNWGDSEAIAVDPKTGWLEGGHDHRASYGKADGY